MSSDAPVKIFVDVRLTPGDYMDRLTIAELRHEYAKSEQDKTTAAGQLFGLQCGYCSASRGPFNARSFRVFDGLLDTNRSLWHLEDEIRTKMHRRHDAAEIVRLVGQIHELNARRAILKKEIDELFGHTAEIKNYQGTDAGGTSGDEDVAGAG